MRWTGAVVGVVCACASAPGDDESDAATLPAQASTSPEPADAGTEPPENTAGDASETSTQVDTTTHGAMTGEGSAVTSSGGNTHAGSTSEPSSEDTFADTGDTGDTNPTPEGITCRDDHRVVAFVANWQPCPTPEQVAAYSHVMVAFAVTYTWSASGNLCDPECTLQPVEGCQGSDLSALVDALHAAGKEVLVSFGGAGMGGVWEGTCGEMVKCWDACIGRAEALADDLTALVATHGLDGVDIDYEYCLHSAEYLDFLETLTLGLRERFDREFPGQRKRLTHAPMDREVDVGEPYFELLRRIAPAIDFLMPQYYNGGDSPFTSDGLARIHAHYDTLVRDVFDGDASRVTVGFCIEPGCAPVATPPEALEVIQSFDTRYPDHGGMFFWAHPDDVGASFSAPFRAYYDETVCQ